MISHLPSAISFRILFFLLLRDPRYGRAKVAPLSSFTEKIWPFGSSRIRVKSPESGEVLISAQINVFFLFLGTRFSLFFFFRRSPPGVRGFFLGNRTQTFLSSSEAGLPRTRASFRVPLVVSPLPSSGCFFVEFLRCCITSFFRRVKGISPSPFWQVVAGFFFFW